jgi:DNA recombination protein RmuC
MDEIAILNFSDPLVLIVLGGTGFLFLLLLMAVRASMRTAKLAEPLAHQIGALGQRVQALGGLHHVSEAQAQAQTSMLQLMEQRLTLVQQQMNENLHGAAHRTIIGGSAATSVGH